MYEYDTRLISVHIKIPDQPTRPSFIYSTHENTHILTNTMTQKISGVGLKVIPAEKFKSWTSEHRASNRAAEQASSHTHASAKSKDIMLQYNWKSQSLCLCDACVIVFSMWPTTHRPWTRLLRRHTSHWWENARVPICHVVRPSL